MKNKGKKREERKIEKDEVTKKTRERVVEKERTGKEKDEDREKEEEDEGTKEEGEEDENEEAEREKGQEEEKDGEKEKELGSKWSILYNILPVAMRARNTLTLLIRITQRLARIILTVILRNVYPVVSTLVSNPVSCHILIVFPFQNCKRLVPVLEK